MGGRRLEHPLNVRVPEPSPDGRTVFLLFRTESEQRGRDTAVLYVWKRRWPEIKPLVVTRPHHVQLNIVSQMGQYFQDENAVTRTAVTHFHLCL